MTEPAVRSVPRTMGSPSVEQSVERGVGNAPWRLWAWPYGLVVLGLLLLWHLIPAGWLWVPLAFVAGVLISLRTRGEVGRHGLGGLGGGTR